MAEGDTHVTKHGVVRENADGKYELLGLERIAGLPAPTDITVTVADGQTEAETAVGVKGLVTVISCLAPSAGNTYTLEVLDTNDIPVYQVTAQVDNTRTINTTQLQVVATDKIKITVGGAVSGAKAYTIQIR